MCPGGLFFALSRQWLLVGAIGHVKGGRSLEESISITRAEVLRAEIVPEDAFGVHVFTVPGANLGAHEDAVAELEFPRTRAQGWSTIVPKPEDFFDLTHLAQGVGRPATANSDRWP